MVHPWHMSGLLPAIILVAITLITGALADEVIYSDTTLSSTWQDWSWGSTINYDATDLYEGTSSISVNSTAYSALSLYDTSVFATYAGLQFDIAGDDPDISITIEDTVDNIDSATISLSAFALPINANNFTTVVVNFNSLPPDGTTLGNASWNRITWQAGGNGAFYHIDNIILLSAITVTPQILSAEPFANNIIALTSQGAVNFSTVEVTLNGKKIPVTGDPVTYVPSETPSMSITYLTLASHFFSGNLSISSGNSTFDYVLGSPLTGIVNQANNYPISRRVYGVNFPTDASYISELGTTIARWGGNAETAYNPNGDFTNAGNDWYFENRANDDGSADSWIEWIEAADSDTILAIPALDWVSKDATSYSYPITLYPDQEAFDPYNGVAGDGLFPNGSWVSPPDPTTVYTPWNTSLAHQWLSNLTHKPTIVTIDNEIEIASNTHQDMHPNPMGYDEELARVLNFSTVAKEAIPDVLVAAPSTCAWWYYWTSDIGASDKAAHNNTDFLPWFLQQLAAHNRATGKRLLDYLDIHYYFAADTSADDPASQALRLRLSRSFWDPTYVDESWIGTSTPQNSEPNANVVMLIPRFQALIAEYYPGTKLSVSEWSSDDETDVSGGLLIADSLGIFGRYKLDSATYWSDPDPTSAAGLAFWLYRGNGTYFGTSSAAVNITEFDPDTLGVYAGTEGGRNLTLVVVNKNPDSPVTLNLAGVPTGTYFLRHFGGEAGIAKYQTTISITDSSYIVVPAYTAVFLQESTAKEDHPTPGLRKRVSSS